jgi:hypothetical protein
MTTEKKTTHCPLCDGQMGGHEFWPNEPCTLVEAEVKMVMPITPAEEVFVERECFACGKYTLAPADRWFECGWCGYI